MSFLGWGPLKFLHRVFQGEFIWFGKMLTNVWGKRKSKYSPVLALVSRCLESDGWMLIGSFSLGPVV